MHRIWQFAISKNWTSENPIKVISRPKGQKKTIPVKELQTILQEIYNRNKKWFRIIATMALTGCRPSSAITLRKSDINLPARRIIFDNIKARVDDKEYTFPIYDSLYNVLSEMDLSYSDTTETAFGFVFVHNYTDPLRFWEQIIKELLIQTKITHRYTLKNLRATFSTFAVNKWKINPYIVKKLIGHSLGQDVLDEHYNDLDYDELILTMNKSTFVNVAEIELQETYKPKAKGKDLEITKDELEKLILEMPPSEIAEKLGCVKSTIYKRIKNWEIKLPDPGYYKKNKNTPFTKEELKAALKKYSYREISLIFNVSKSTIARRVIEWELKNE